MLIWLITIMNFSFINSNVQILRSEPSVTYLEWSWTGLHLGLGLACLQGLGCMIPVVGCPVVGFSCLYSCDLLLVLQKLQIKL